MQDKEPRQMLSVQQNQRCLTEMLLMKETAIDAYEKYSIVKCEKSYAW
jgi:hypothetical protein